MVCMAFATVILGIVAVIGVLSHNYRKVAHAMANTALLEVYTPDAQSRGPDSPVSVNISRVQDLENFSLFLLMTVTRLMSTKLSHHVIHKCSHRVTPIFLALRVLNPIMLTGAVPPPYHSHEPCDHNG